MNTSPEAILDALDPEQRQVATILRGPLAVLAGAGTGKTRAITHRIAYGVCTGVYQPNSVLAVTFTARAAGEMRSRLRDLGVQGVQARTFHAAALRQLGYFWPRVIGGEPGRIVEHKAQLVAEAARQVGVPVDRVAIRDLASEIEWAKVSLIDPEAYPDRVLQLGRTPPAGHDAVTIARLASRYEEVKAVNGALDFEDILLILAAIYQEHGEAAAQVRRQYRHFVVDEYQDVSPLQQFLLDQWLGSRDEICVVGDPAQTIYSFTGATADYLLGFRTRFPGAAQVNLERDYRSTPQVVHLANTLLRKGRVPGALELRAQRSGGPPVAYVAYDDDVAEATGVAARCARLIAAGTKASEIAVLYRTNSQSVAFEDALDAAGIGFQLRGSERFFHRPEVKQAVMLLRAAARAPDERPMPDLVRDALGVVGWAPKPPAAQGAARDRWDAMVALVALAEELAQRPGDAPATLGDLVSELDERIAAQHAPTVEGVTLASLHSAKGLEWDAVFLVGISEGLLPISLAETDSAIAEERRLLYVGITRARIHLQISYARSRSAGGRGTRKVSRFLTGIWPDDGPAGKKPAARKRGQGAREIAEAAGHGAAFEALRVWRTDRAREAGKPAYTVLPDAVLCELVQAQPASKADLARVHGMGPIKIERYGEEVLGLLRQFPPG